MTQLRTTTEVIDVLGGNSAVSELTGSKPKAVSMWKTLGAFPWRTQLIITEELRKRRLCASADLWGIKQPKKRAA